MTQSREGFVQLPCHPRILRANSTTASCIPKQTPAERMENTEFRPRTTEPKSPSTQSQVRGKPGWEKPLTWMWGPGSDRFYSTPLCSHNILHLLPHPFHLSAVTDFFMPRSSQPPLEPALRPPSPHYRDSLSSWPTLTTTELTAVIQLSLALTQPILFKTAHSRHRLVKLLLQSSKAATQPLPLFLLMHGTCFSPKKGFFCFLAQEIAWILPSVPRTPNPPGTRTPLHEDEKILVNGAQQPGFPTMYSLSRIKS